MTEASPADAVTVRSNVVAGFAAVVAALVGIGAIMLSGWASGEGWKLLIALGMLIGGGMIMRRETGIGTAGVVLGAYLTGATLVALSIPDGPIFGSDRSEIPPPTAILLMMYGVPLIALIVLAARGSR